MCMNMCMDEAFTDSFPAPTNFKFLARHEDLSIRNDGWWLAGLQSVSFIESTETVKEYLQHIWKNKNQSVVISRFSAAGTFAGKLWRSSTFPLQELWFKFSSDLIQTSEFIRVDISSLDRRPQ